MPRTIPTTEFEHPETGVAEFHAGDSVAFDVAQDTTCTIADGWSLTYAIRSERGTLDLGAGQITENGTTYEVRIAASLSEQLNPGRYRWTALLTNGTDRFVWRTGDVYVHANALTLEPSTDSLEDQLARVRARIAEMQAAGVEEFQLNGRGVKRTTLDALRRDEAAIATAILMRDNGGSPFIAQHGARFQ